MQNVVLIKTLENFDPALALPSYQSEMAAGADVRVCLSTASVVIKPWERVALPTGLSFEIAANFEIQVRPRSGLSLKTGLMLLNSPGTIDADYRGELKILMINNSPDAVTLNHGERIAQLVLSPVLRADFQLTNNKLSDTARGEKGFGSTGLS